MATIRNNQSGKEHWYETGFMKGLGIVISIAAVFGLGYGFSEFKNNLENKVDKAKAEQECNERVEVEKSKNQALKAEYSDKKVQELVQVVEELKKVKDGK